MRRSNRAWCGILLGLAVLAGCAKKPKPDSAASGQPAPTPSPAPAAYTPPTPKPRPTSGQVAVTQPTQAKPEPKLDGDTVTSGTGTVELVSCRFDRVEAALSAAKGKVVLVDCWARWCPPCIATFPKLVEKNEKYGPKGLVCVSVSIDNGRNAFNTDQVLSFLKEKKATFQNFYLSDLRADSAVMDRRFGKVSSIPHGVLFNRKGDKVWEGHPMDPGLVAKIETELTK